MSRTSVLPLEIGSFAVSWFIKPILIPGAQEYMIKWEIHYSPVMGRWNKTYIWYVSQLTLSVDVTTIRVDPTCEETVTVLRPLPQSNYT